MAHKIKLFLYVQKSVERVGIDRPLPNQNGSMSSKRVFISIFNVQIFITASASIYELAFSFYLSTTSFVVQTFYNLSIIYIADIFNLIGKFEQFIQKSKKF